jgi:hypothetical protein
MLPSLMMIIISPLTRWPNLVCHYILYLTVKRGVGGVKGKTGKSVYTAVIMKFVISGRHFDKLAKCGLKLGAKG